jgi:glycosyltransferase involved in cell wall biosynthesis
MRIGYVEHPHHQKSNSTNFFINEFINRGLELTRIKRDDFSLREAKTFDFLILFQADECIAIASESGVKTLVIPMLDESLHRKSLHFRYSEKVTYLSFSKVLHDFLRFSGCNSNYIQYWPKTEPVRTVGDRRPTVFFWERTPEHVREYDVLNWFRNYDYNLLFRKHRDPGHLEGIAQNYSITDRVTHLSSEWLEQADYYEILSNIDIFVAPRRWEGIGVSMLEALVRGIPVIGLNSPTLNEYVITGMNGVLVGEKYKPLDEYDFREMSKKTIERSVQGNKDYEAKIQPFLNDFLESKNNFYQRYASIPKSLTLRHYIFLMQGR